MWRSMAALVRPYQREALAGRLRVVGSQAGSSTLAWSSLAPQFLGFFRKSSHDCNVGQSAVRAGPSCAESSLFGKRYTHLHTKSTAPCRSLFRSNYFQVRSISSTPTTNGNAPSWLFSKSQPAPKSSPETDRKPESVQRRPPSKVDDAPEEVSSVASRDNWNRTPADLRQSSNAETDADRRQRSLEQTASTSSSPAASASAARKPTVQHPTPKYSSTVPQPASPATPNTGSQYAQKASTQQRSRLGNKPIRDLLQSKSITLPDYSPGQKRTQCPMCAGGTSHEESLALHISEDSQSAKWICHRATCGWEGGIDQGSAMPRSQKPLPNRAGKPDISAFKPLDAQLTDYFASRGISKDTLERNRVAQEHTWMPGQPAGTAIAFPYLRNGEVANVKYRTLDKKFRQVKGAEKILYGLDDAVGQDTIIIVEGEIDKLSLEEAGFRNVVSVPDGAPAKVKEGALPRPDADTKYSYLWECRAVLDQASRILVATDNDDPGHALAEELARRLGRERCYRVSWALPTLPPPEADSLDPQEAVQSVVEGSGEGPLDALQRKDANEVLVKDGPEALRQCIDLAEPLPIRGLFRFADFEQELWGLYNLEHSDQLGKSSGWNSLDEFYRVVPGELTIITGVPNSGKSEWIDALMVNLSDQFGWRFGLCSMEKKAKDHARQLMEKYLSKPFFDGLYAGSTPRMTPQDWEEGLTWINDRFFPIRYEDEALPSVDWVLNVAKAAVLRYGIRGLLIDPYNELDHQRPAHMSETEYVSQMLTKIKRFAQHHDVHVWFVAHPRQLRDWRGQPPTMYDISGSAHFINKADNGVVIHRNRDPQAGPMNQVQIFVRKVRNKAAGTIGDCYLEYDRVTGRYLDPGQSVQHGDVLDAFVRPPEVASTQLQIPEAAPEMILQPNAPIVDRVEHSRHSPEIQGRRRDPGEVEWEDLAPHPTDQLKRYVAGQTS